MANFSGCNFKLTKPIFARTSDGLSINTTLSFDSGSNKDVILNNIIISVSPNKYDYDACLKIDAHRMNKNISLTLKHTDKYKQSKIYFEFIRQDNKAIEIVYKVNSSGVVELNDVNIKAVGPGVYDKVLEGCDCDTIVRSNNNFTAYLRSLEEELKFQKENGGRQYKVTGGEFINSTEQKNYAYGFELESELSISEDSPVKLFLGPRQINGNVLSLEGFHIVLILEEYLGETVPVAKISVTPWKLLEALLEKLDSISGNHKIANLLIDNKCDKNKSINDILKGQEKAFERSLNSPVTIIWGPPGTGKTYSMAKIAMEFMLKGKTVLMVSHSNISVDGFVCELAKQIYNSGSNLLMNYAGNGKILRYGFIKDDRLRDDRELVAFNYALDRLPTLRDERDKLLKQKDEIKDPNSPLLVNINKRLNEIRKKVKDKEKEVALGAKLLATTVSKVCIDDIFCNYLYDVVLFDEASMAYVPQVVMSAMYAREHFICVGDFRQLSPICQNKRNTLITKDIFYYLGINNDYGKLQFHPWLVLLNEQRRMHPKIAAFSNTRFYNGLIENHESTSYSREKIINSQPFATKPVTLIDLTGTYSLCGRNSDNSRYNLLSAVISFETAVCAIKNGKAESVGIITPYAAQSRLIKAMIRDRGANSKIACSTVHQFQGSERDLIIFDAVESAPNDKPGLLMRSNDNNSLDRLINVAITRAKGKLVVVADSRYWSETTKSGPNTFTSLLRYLKDKENVVNLENGKLKKYLKGLSNNGNITVSQDYDVINEKLYIDIKKAKQTILVSLADTVGFDDQKLFKAVDIQNDKGIEVAGKTNDYSGLPKQWTNYIKVAEETCFPVIKLDNNILYYEIPVTKGKIQVKDHNYYVQLPIFIRITGKYTTELFTSLSDLEYRIVAGVKIALFGTIEPVDLVGKDSRFKEYIENKQICPNCGKPMKMVPNSKGVFFMKCLSKTCPGLTYITTEMVEDYINDNVVCCRHHKSILEARLGYKGVFACCDRGCTYSLNEI